MRSDRTVWLVSAILVLSALRTAGGQGLKIPPDVGRITVAGQGADKDEAVADALAEAARRGVMSVMADQTKTPAYRVARDTISVAGAGFVENWGVLSGPDTQGGTCKVTLWAVVSERKIKAYCARAKAVVKIKGTPTILVHIPETLNGRPREPSVVRTTIVQPLLKSGFAVVDTRQLDAATRGRIRAAAQANDAKKLQAIAGEWKAQIVVTGDAGTVYKGTKRVRGVLLHHHSARGGVKCYRSDTARVLVSHDTTADLADVSEARAGEKCLHAVGDALAAKSHPEILRFWYAAIQGFSGVDLTVGGLTYRKALEIEKRLKTIPGVSGVTLLSFDAGVAVWSLMGKLGGKDVARALVTTMTDMEIAKVTAGAVTARWKE